MAAVVVQWLLNGSEWVQPEKVSEISLYVRSLCVSECGARTPTCVVGPSISHVCASEIALKGARLKVNEIYTLWWACGTHTVLHSQQRRRPQNGSGADSCQAGNSRPSIGYEYIYRYVDTYSMKKLPLQLKWTRCVLRIERIIFFQYPYWVSCIHFRRWTDHSIIYLVFS